MFKDESCLIVCVQLQACQGKHYDFGVEVAGDIDETDSSPEPANIRKIPVEADCFYAYSVVPGKKICTMHNFYVS